MVVALKRVVGLVGGLRCYVNRPYGDMDSGNDIPEVMVSFLLRAVAASGAALMVATLHHACSCQLLT